ncbi:MAG: ribulose-phosphate 3-epimerase [Planctomycetia bacterium]|nr:ribulose-phosphate 3-epimerase [Planctomycetia bacterium]
MKKGLSENPMFASREKFCRLSTFPGTILPSILACDFTRLEKEIRQVEEAGATALHLDIMDGHFVPNLSFGIPIVEAVRRLTEMVLDVHLMLSEPQDYVEAFRKAGADALTFHLEAIADQVEAGHHFDRHGCRRETLETFREVETKTAALLEKVHALGAANGLSIIPPTEVELLEPYLPQCDNVLIMSVMPGFGGQSFDTSALGKLNWLREHAPAKMLRSVDGGVNAGTLGECVRAGATGWVMGTAIFDGQDCAARFLEFQKQVRNF